MKQLTLDLTPLAEPSFDNYIAGPNAEALERVRALAEGRLAEPVLYLWGESGSGRSHLLGAARRASPRLVVADDVEELSAQAQHALFVAINAARDGAPAVLAAGARPPALLALREDVRTRLAWGLVYELRPLDDADKARHLKADAERRGLRLSDEVVDYLLARLPRSLASLRAVLERLDRFSLARQRPITVPLVREWLAEGGESATADEKTTADGRRRE
ncbi:MAG: HdaA/DnaA family protein [Betaproteobacteria bacterium]